MPTSVPGASSRRGCTPRREPGFTLIELLVVLLIMGVCVGLVGAIARPDDRATTRLEAERLAQLFDLAAVEARLTGKAVAWTAAPTAQGMQYRFWRRRDDGGWSDSDRDVHGDELRARRLPPGMAISQLRIEAMPSPAGLRLEFSPYGAPVFDLQVTLGAVRYMVAASPLGDVHVSP